MQLTKAGFALKLLWIYLFFCCFFLFFGSYIITFESAAYIYSFLLLSPIILYFFLNWGLETLHLTCFKALFGTWL